ncbi:MAG: hypothetical protein K1000chlam3_01543 [Chlamydiae bacterium]|nr:hypothetical protein [Chlamydiota bacterium]
MLKTALMKKNDSTHLRIKTLISKAVKEEIEKTKKSRTYKTEKTTPIPPGIDTISVKNTKKKGRPLGKAKVILQKNQKSTFEQMHCTQNQNYPLFFIEKAERLRMRKVRNVKVKERLIVARNLKKLSHQMQQWMHQEIRVLGEDSQEFYELLERREERHFQIDRIIRYLSDM